MMLLAAVCTISTVAANNAQYQDVNYSLDEFTLTAEVIATPKASGELFLPEQIIVGQHTYTVIAIGDKAFRGCKTLTAIVLPPTLQRVYRSAFDGTGVKEKNR